MDNSSIESYKRKVRQIVSLFELGDELGLLRELLMLAFAALGEVEESMEDEAREAMKKERIIELLEGHLRGIPVLDVLGEAVCDEEGSELTELDRFQREVANSPEGEYLGIAEWGWQNYGKY